MDYENLNEYAEELEAAQCENCAWWQNNENDFCEHCGEYLTNEN